MQPTVSARNVKVTFPLLGGDCKGGGLQGGLPTPLPQGGPGGEAEARALLSALTREGGGKQCRVPSVPLAPVYIGDDSCHELHMWCLMTEMTMSGCA